MAKVEIKMPNTITIEYHQEKGDKYYGSCLWARFVLDLDNYDMHITSDCGSYGNCWVPTPDTESLLRLLSRMDTEYLLRKIADRNTVDTDKTYSNVKEYLEYLANKENLDDIGIDMESLYTACTYDDPKEIVDAIYSEISGSVVYDMADNFEIFECIYMDYSVNQKKIGEVFEGCIKPKIKEMLDDEKNTKL